MTELEHLPGCWRPLANYWIEVGWCWAWCSTCGALDITRTTRQENGQ